MLDDSVVGVVDRIEPNNTAVVLWDEGGVWHGQIGYLQRLPGRVTEDGA